MDEFEAPTTHIGHLNPSEHPAYLTSPFFPSKIGGKPAWLDPVNVPDTIACPSCNEIMTFLLQIYAASDNPQAFHRTIFVFTCLPCKNQFRTFRCQLPRDNPFFSYYPLNPISPSSSATLGLHYENPSFIDSSHFTNDFGNDIFSKKWKSINEEICCSFCGTRKGPIHKRCEIAEKHQTLLTTFKEQSIDIEDTYEVDEEEIIPSVVDLTHEEFLLKKYQNETQNFPENDLDSSEEDAFEEINSTNTHQDQNFNKFLSFLNLYPGHIIRYSRGGHPLWFSDQNSDPIIPNCELCGAKRIFEFQIQPTLISRLNDHSDMYVPSLEFGVICIFCCSQDCQRPQWDKKAYLEEFTYTQADPFFLKT